MILPTKHVPARQSLIGLGGLVLRHLEMESTLSELWERMRTLPEVGTFTRLVLALDLLFAMGIVEWHDGVLHRTRP